MPHKHENTKITKNSKNTICKTNKKNRNKKKRKTKKLLPTANNDKTKETNKNEIIQQYNNTTSQLRRILWIIYGATVGPTDIIMTIVEEFYAVC